MDEREYTLQLTREELILVRFGLDIAAQLNEQRATAADEQAAQGFGTREAGEYWREQTALCRAAAAKAEATLYTGTSGEV